MSARAATALREGNIDGRVLVVLASLATADLLTAVDVPPSGSVGPADAANLEMGVVDVERVLDWLDNQTRLHPDRMEVRRDGAARLIFCSSTTALNRPDYFRRNDLSHLYPWGNQ